MNIKGSLPLLTLQMLSQQPLHGYRLAKEIEKQSEGVLTFAEGTLYPTLHSMEKQGLIESFEQEEKGRTRRYYRLTQEGEASLAVERQEWKQYVEGVNLILGEAS